MRVRMMSVIGLLVCAAVAVPMLAQQGATPADPLSGTWTGDWGPSPGDRNQVNVELKWDGKALTGVVKSVSPARADVTLTNSSFSASTQTVKMEAEAKNPRGGETIKYVIEGKLSGNTMTGSWNHDSRKGDFKLTKK
jgi:hypothetical protein